MSAEHSNGRPPTVPKAIEQVRRAQARPSPDTIDWPDNTGLEPEIAILRDAEALIEAGLAEWIEEGE